MPTQQELDDALARLHAERNARDQLQARLEAAEKRAAHAEAVLRARNADIVVSARLVAQRYAPLYADAVHDVLLDCAPRKPIVLALSRIAERDSLQKRALTCRQAAQAWHRRP